MADKRIIDKLRKLFAMADSPVEEEARTAALMAVRLLKKHGFESRIFSSATSVPAATVTANSTHVQRQPDLYTYAVAQRVGCCKACGQLYIAGESVLVGMKTHGTTHERCQKYWYS